MISGVLGRVVCFLLYSLSTHVLAGQVVVVLSLTLVDSSVVAGGYVVQVDDPSLVA